MKRPSSLWSFHLAINGQDTSKDTLSVSKDSVPLMASDWRIEATEMALKFDFDNSGESLLKNLQLEVTFSPVRLLHCALVRGELPAFLHPNLELLI